MKKISRYLIIIVVIGGILVSFWSYQKYFKEEAPELLLFSVEIGSIQEIVKVRGEVVSQKDFNLEFPFSGIVESIFVQEGQQVAGGAPLMKLETTDFELEVRKIQAQLAQAEASFSAQKAKLSELRKGTRPEEIRIQEIKVANAETALLDAKNNLVNKLQDAYTKSDDAVRNKVDQFFSNPRSSNPQLNFLITNSQLKSDTEWQRVIAGTTLKSWESSLNQLEAESDFPSYVSEAEENLGQVKLLLDRAASSVNSAAPSASLSQATIDGWKSDVAIARTNINTAATNLLAAEEKLGAKESSLALAQQELVLKEAGTIEEQINAQEAQVKRSEADIQSRQAQIAIVREKIKKSTLYAPETSKIVKVWFEKRELFKPGSIAVTLETPGQKIQTDISELEIGKIREFDGNEVLIQLDAFPELELKGRIISIEPKEIIKDGDKYYRTNVSVEQYGSEIRSGMNADLTILIFSKDNVLKIPELTIYRKGDKKFVIVLEGGVQKEIEIGTGISDGESIEVTIGLSENQTIVVSAD